MQQDFNAKADEQKGAEAAVSAAVPETVVVGETADESAKAQAQQDALRSGQQQAEEEESRLRKQFKNSVDPEKESWLKQNSADLLLHHAGEGVKFNDHEVDLHYDVRKGPSQKQIDRAIDVAMKKGWDHLYIYDKAGKPDLKMAAAINQRIVDRGLQDKLCCCTNPREMCATLAEMRRMVAEKASGRTALVGDKANAPAAEEANADAHDHDNKAPQNAAVAEAVAAPAAQKPLAAPAA